MTKPLILIASILTSTAPGHHPTLQHRRAYLHAYAKAVRLFGHRAPGCKLIGPRATCHIRVSDRRLTASLAVLSRMLHPSPTAPPPPPGAPAPPPSSPTTAGAGGLVACIIRAESSGNPTASNGAHSGLGGWDQTAWQQDGGTRYASTPTGASYSQQVAVLNGEGSSPQGFGQQTKFDGC